MKRIRKIIGISMIIVGYAGFFVCLLLQNIVFLAFMALSLLGVLVGAEGSSGEF